MYVGTAAEVTSSLQYSFADWCFLSTFNDVSSTVNEKYNLGWFSRNVPTYIPTSSAFPGSFMFSSNTLRTSHIPQAELCTNVMVLGRQTAAWDTRGGAPSVPCGDSKEAVWLEGT